MAFHLLLSACLSLAPGHPLGDGPGERPAPLQSPASAPMKTVVFVCEHGSVKSLIAASFFNRLAEAQGLPFHAIARGQTPEAQVPEAIRVALRSDGFDVAGYRPSAYSAKELPEALRVVAIGVPVAAGPPGSATLDRWDDVPAASEDYPASRAALQRHIEALLKDLQKGLSPR